MFDLQGHSFVPTCLRACRRAQRRGREIGGRPGCGERMRSPWFGFSPGGPSHAGDATLLSVCSISLPRSEHAGKLAGSRGRTSLIRRLLFAVIPNPADGFPSAGLAARAARRQSPPIPNPDEEHFIRIWYDRVESRCGPRQAAHRGNGDDARPTSYPVGSFDPEP